MQALAQSLNMSQTILYYATQFYNRWPELSNALESFTEGKEISWFMIVKKYLPKPKKSLFISQKGNGMFFMQTHRGIIDWKCFQCIGNIIKRMIFVIKL